MWDTWRRHLCRASLIPGKPFDQLIEKDPLLSSFHTGHGVLECSRDDPEWWHVRTRMPTTLTWTSCRDVSPSPKVKPLEHQQRRHCCGYALILALLMSAQKGASVAILNKFSTGHYNITCCAL